MTIYISNDPKVILIVEEMYGELDMNRKKEVWVVIKKVLLDMSEDDYDEDDSYFLEAWKLFDCDDSNQTKMMFSELFA
jgi:hypothetical protein